MAKFKKTLKDNLPTILGILTLIGLVIGILNFYILATIAPFAKQLAVQAQEIQVNEQRDLTDHATFVTMDTFNQVVTRLDHISNRVDTIYSIVAKK